MKVVGTIEARMGSTRLPEKTMKEVYNGMTLLDCVVTRFKLCKSIDEVVVATTIEKQDDPIAHWCKEHNVSCVRGSEEDVLDRVVQALVEYDADVCVQFGADSAYLDYNLVDSMVELYKRQHYDYVCSDLKATFPIGVYAHIVNAKKLIELNKKTNLSIKDRDDVVRYIFEHPEEYRIHNIEAPREYFCPELRLTIDYSEDLQQAREIYNYFNGHTFNAVQVIELYRQKPEMFEKTMNLIQRSVPYMQKKDTV